MNMTHPIEQDILDLLAKQSDMYTAEIAGILGRSATTVSKYLLVAQSRGVIEAVEKKPYKFWRLSE